MRIPEIILSIDGYLPHGSEEKPDPPEQVICRPYPHEIVIAYNLVSLKIIGQIECRSTQNSLAHQIQCDHQTTNPPIAIQKWMNGFKLIVCDRDPNQLRYFNISIGPGTKFVAPRRSRKFAWDIQPLRLTTSSSVIAICAAGPPKAVVPSFKNSKESSFAVGSSAGLVWQIMNPMTIDHRRR